MNRSIIRLVLFGFLMVAVCESVACGDLLVAPNRLPIPEGHSRVYRAVSEAEYQDILNSGKLRQGPNSLEGKWFADSIDGAHAHATGAGKTPPLFPNGKYRIIEVDIPNNAPSLSTRPNLDGHGPASYLHNNDLPNLVPRPLDR